MSTCESRRKEREIDILFGAKHSQQQQQQQQHTTFTNPLLRLETNSRDESNERALYHVKQAQRKSIKEEDALFFLVFKVQNHFLDRLAISSK